MRTFSCNCGNRVFFENSACVACGSELGWCPGCNALVNLIDNDGYECGSCRLSLTKCHNYFEHNVCNRMVAAQNSMDPALCDYCRFNDTIPDLSDPDNLSMWGRLETAKRRLFYTLDLLKVPYGNAEDGIEPPLSFDFKGDQVKPSKWWWRMGTVERVYTGHAGGKITINIKEADDVEREKLRVSLSEAHRTVIGHFRHEMGHYFWETLVRGKCEEACIDLFGDHNQSYADALQQHYQNGPPGGWQHGHISSYATMHPWEDFAESFATYLDMVSVLDTAFNMGMSHGVDPRTASFEQMISSYIELGVVLNEMNRSMGLIDLVPEIIRGPVVTKLEFMHNLLRQAGG